MDKQSNKENERLQSVIEKLKERGVISTNQSLADAIGKHKSTVSNIINSNANVSDEVKMKFIKVFGVSRRYIETGEPPMFVDGQRKIDDNEVLKLKDEIIELQRKLLNFGETYSVKVKFNPSKIRKK